MLTQVVSAVHHVWHDSRLRAAGQGRLDRAALILDCGRPIGTAAGLQKWARGEHDPASVRSLAHFVAVCCGAFSALQCLAGLPAMLQWLY